MTEKLKIRRRERLSAEASHELKVVDDALVGLNTETPDDAALTDFVMRLRSSRPTADAEAYGRLDARFAERIDRERAEAISGGAGGRRPVDRFARRILRPAPLAGALAAVMIGVTAISLVEAQRQGLPGQAQEITAVDRGDAKPAYGESVASPNGVPSAGGAADDVSRSRSLDALVKSAPSELAAGAESGPGVTRKVESTGDLVLAARSDKVETVSDDVIALTDRFGGFVTSSSVTGGDAANAGAHFELKFPAARFQEALAELSGFAHVRSRTQATQDITDPYSRARNRLAAARAERGRLRVKLAATASDGEAKVLRARLRTADRHVNAREAEFKQLRNRVNFVSLSLSVVADDSAAADDRGTISRAAGTAFDVLVYFTAVGLVALAISLPLALIAAFAIFATRRFRRNRGDAVISGASEGGGEPPV